MTDALASVAAAQSGFIRDGNPTAAYYHIVRGLIAASGAFAGGLAEVHACDGDGRMRIAFAVTLGLIDAPGVGIEPADLLEIARSAAVSAERAEHTLRLRRTAQCAGDPSEPQRVTCIAQPALDAGAVVAVILLLGNEGSLRLPGNTDLAAPLAAAGAIAGTARPRRVSQPAATGRDTSAPAVLPRPRDDGPGDFTRLFEAAGDGYAVLDADGRLRYCNRAFARPFGGDPAALAGLTLGQIARRPSREPGHPADARLGYPAFLGHDLTAPDPIDDPVTDIKLLRTSNGASFEIRSAPTADGCTLIHQRETTAERDAAAAHETRARDLATLLDAAPVGLLTVGSDGRVREVGAPAAALLGRRPGDVVGLPVAALIDLDPGTGAAGHGLPAPPWRIAALLHPDGRRERVLAARSGDACDGAPIAVYALRAADEMEAAERLIVAAERAEEEATRVCSSFLANMSHELRTPLNAVIGFSESLESRAFGPLNDRQAEYIRDIHSAGRHLLDIIEHVLDYAKIEAGRFELDEERIDLRSLIGETFRIVQPLAGRAGVTLQGPRGESAPSLRGDRRAMRQILINLLSNAIKFTEPGGSVAVRLGIVNDEPVLTVEDTGRGMAEADIPRVLQPFGQVRAGGTERGTGLGLSIVNSLVELHGGRLRIDSAPGLGTTVDVVFPAERRLTADAAD